MALKVINTTPGGDGSGEEARGIALRREERAFLRRLVELRREAELSQTEVAERMGIDRSFVSRFEKFDSAPRLDTVVRYAHAIGAILHLDAELDRRDVDEFPETSKWVDTVVSAELAPARPTASRKRWGAATC